MSISRSFDPVQDMWSYAAEMSYREKVEQSVLDEMYNLKHEAMERIDSVIHPEYAADFIKLLSHGMSEKQPDAESLALKMGLGQHHFAALDDDTYELARLIQKERFDCVGAQQYHDREYDRYEDYI